MISNPMANLSVATQAAEIQIEEADISLANTLDTIRATGASAGGATALAQAALQSKRGVSASIEQQEAQNEKLRAQGKQQMEQMKMTEAQRIQQAEASGKQFDFGAQENRDMAKMDRLSAQISGAAAQQSQASSDRVGAITGTVSALGLSDIDNVFINYYDKKPTGVAASQYNYEVAIAAAYVSKINYASDIIKGYEYTPFYGYVEVSNNLNIDNAIGKRLNVII
jgi:hypothetical protein